MCFAVPVLAVLLVATGCAGLAPHATAPNPYAPPLIGAPGESSALGLVNLWRVSGADGEGANTWLRLDAGEFQLWRDCGMIMGSWRATDTLFLGSANGATGGCATDGLPTVAWLDHAKGFVATVGGYELVDGVGEAVASLTVDGAPAPIPDAAEFFTQPPEITPEVRAQFQAAAGLPAELVAGSTAQLEGRWTPVATGFATDPHIVFNADGSWSGSDGCNGGGGRWIVGASGEFLATSGPSTLMYCEGEPVPSWVAQAASAGFDPAGSLILVDRAGAEIGRLSR